MRRVGYVVAAVRRNRHTTTPTAIARGCAGSCATTDQRASTLSLSWVPAESCSLLDDIGQLSRRVRVEELEKIVQHFLSAAFDVGEDGLDVAEQVVGLSACECSAFVASVLRRSRSVTDEGTGTGETRSSEPNRT